MITQLIEARHSFKSQRFSALTLAFVILTPVDLTRAELPQAKPEEAGMRSDRLAAIEDLVRGGLAQQSMPGCVIVVGRWGKIVFHEAYGHRQLEPAKLPMKKDTVFDMASITKPVATATSVMVLLEQGRIRLRDKVSTYIPEFANGGKQHVTVHQLLTHQAGFVPDNAIADYEKGRNKAFDNIYKLETSYEPGERFVYSDVGFILLDDLIERQSGMSIAEFSRRHLFQPLGMSETGYLPSDTLKARAAVTQQRDNKWMQGEVHDPRAYLMNGVAGHAGVFSTAKDLAVYAQMMLNGGHYKGQRILSRATVELMTSDTVIVEGKKTSIRGLGWDKLSGYSSNRGENFSQRAYGHGGFTGTVLWIDPELDLFLIFLSNRVHPDGKGSVNRLAGRIATVVGSAIDDELPMTLASPAKTLNGIDVLKSNGFDILRNQRIGLITNQTGIDTKGVSTVQLLKESPHVDLQTLFSPEHGIAGELDQNVVTDSVDDSTGLQIYSLYGSTREPTKQQLDTVDTLVFDIQDIGCRFYTYISTMGLAMKAAAKHRKRFVVLDRPNPINGVEVSGPMLDAGKESFVGFHPLPIRHGMTTGELARMFNTELKLNLDLRVVPCDSWNRHRYFDETALWWVNPSPNMRNLNQAILYPGIGVWETTNISVGRGTDTPFEIVGAPWIDGRQLAEALHHAGLQGVRFTPRAFVPDSSRFADQLCQGIQISITDREQLDPIALGLELASALWKLYPEHWDVDKSMRLLSSQQTLDAIKSGKTGREILELNRANIHRFRERRQKFLAY